MNRQFREAFAVQLLRFTTYAIVCVIGFILLDIIFHGLPVINWGFLSEMPRRGGSEGGILPAIVGTLYLTLGTVAIALPVGIGTAVYLSEYATPSRLTETIRLAITTLAGVPSIVFGLFGLGLFVLFCRFGPSLLAGSLTLACMVLPTIIVTSEESLRAVPQTFRQASLALGATKWEAIRTAVLPYSMSGIITGAILGIGRAAGETAPILLTVAAFFLPKLPKSIFDQVMALPYHLYILATQHPDTDKVLPLQYGTAFVLLFMVLGLSLGAIFIRIHFRRKYKW